MSLKIVVLIKQVPDTRSVGKDAMTQQGTINRAALPSIINPEDLNALEMALNIKDKIKDTKVTVLTMGLPSSKEIIKDAIYRGADCGVVLTDKALGGSDTLATSYAISQSIKHLDKFDIVFSGREAIDGDTAQVGPQTAEKLHLPQITYAEQIMDISENQITIKRRLTDGIELVRCPLPVLITVHSSAEGCRFYNAKRLMAYKRYEPKELTATDIEAEPSRIGLTGSPTKVKKIDNVVLQHKDTLFIQKDDNQIDNLMKELINTHILG